MAFEDKKGGPGNELVLKQNGELQPYENLQNTEGLSNASVETPETKMDRIKGENLASCAGISQFFLFITCFSSAMILNQSVATSRLGDHIRGKLNPSYFPVSLVTNVDTLYEYLEEVVVPALYENTTDVRMAESLSPYMQPIDISNRMLGTVRLRQARVALKDNCQVTPLFEKFTVSCYPSFAGDTASQAAFGPEEKFVHSVDEQGIAYTGTFATYGSDGFMELLATNSSLAVDQIKKLKTEGFMDSATRALFVEFNVWNSNVGLYAVVALVVEFGASGGVSQKIEIATMTQRALNVGGLGQPWDWVAFVLLLCVMFFVIQFIFEEVQELYGSWKTYFFDAWNLLDWINMILLLIGFTLRILLFIDAGNANIGMQQLTNSDSFQNLSAYTSSSTTVRVLNAFNCVLLWGKVSKYLRHLPLVKNLIKTVWSAFDLFLPFLIMFAVAFLGFVMAFNIGFGDKLTELSNFTTSAVYLCRAFLKDVQLMPVYHITPLFGAGLILLFYVNMMLVGLALMFAMMADALFNAKYSKAMQQKFEEGAYWHEDEPMEEFARSTSNVIRRCVIRLMPGVYVRYKRYVQSRQQEEDEMAGLDDKATDKDKGGLALENGSQAGSWRNANKKIEDDARSSQSGFSGSSDGGRARPSPEELLRAIEHMSGRILSEITVVGIEIKSELHDVTERIAQMQMAVEELTWRTDKVRSDQEAEMAEPDQ